MTAYRMCVFTIACGYMHGVFAPAVCISALRKCLVTITFCVRVWQTKRIKPRHSGAWQTCLSTRFQEDDIQRSIVHHSQHSKLTSNKRPRQHRIDAFERPTTKYRITKPPCPSQTTQISGKKQPPSPRTVPPRSLASTASRDVESLICPSS
jgi:hypothetical protein